MTCLITTYANYTVATNIESKIIKNVETRENTLQLLHVNGKEEEQHISQW